MKQLLICAGILIAATASLSAQQKPPASPAETATATIAGKSISITYNSPKVKGREGHVYTSDGLIKTAHGSQYPIWRGGANAATTLKTDAYEQATCDG
jgi:phospholipase/lecithinase/hemolysin